jgi:hypothetical protein
MIENSQYLERIDPDNPPIEVFHELLEAAFTPKDLRHLCQKSDKFSSLNSEFSPSDGLVDMVDRVIVYCRKQILWVELLSEVKKANPNQYERFKPRLFSEPPLYTRRDRKGASSGDLLIELHEWKVIHKDLQDLADKLSCVLSYLTSYRLTGDGDKLDDAGKEWQRSCEKTLELVHLGWDFQFVDSLAVDKVREYAFESKVEEIRERLLPPEIKQEEIEAVNLDLSKFINTCWVTMTIADREIIKLIDIMKQME